MIKKAAHLGRIRINLYEIISVHVLGNLAYEKAKNDLKTTLSRLLAFSQ
jgi:hypothetical protein